MMDVDDAVHTRIYDIVHDLIDTVHPFVIDLSVSIHMDSPCHRNTYGTETGILHHHHEFRSGDRLSPTGFPFLPVPAVRSAGPPYGIKSVSEIPADSHAADGIIG